VRFRGRLHWLLWARAWAALILLGVFIIRIVILFHDLVYLTTTAVAITARPLIRKQGFLEQHAKELEIGHRGGS
jgi:hypothetical protein